MKGLLKNRLVLWWCVSYLLVSLISFAFGVVIYLHSREIIEEEISFSNEMVLRQIRDNMDRKLTEIKKIGFELKWDSDVQGLNYYREPLTNLQIYRISQIMNKLSIYSTSNSVVEEILLYYPQFGAVITPNSKYDAEFYFSKSKVLQEKQLNTWKTAGIFSGEKAAAEDFGNSQLVWVEPITSSERYRETDSIVILLDEAVFFNALEDLSQSPESILTIANADGEIFYSSREEVFPLSRETRDDLQVEKNYIINEIPSTVSDWTYTFMVPKELYLRKLNEMAVFAVYAAVSIGALGFLIALFLSCVNYRPIKKTVKILTSFSGAQKDCQSDYLYIQQQIRRIHYHNTQMKQILQTQNIRLGKMILSGFLTQGGPSDFPILDVMEQYHLEFRYSSFVVMSIFFRGESIGLPLYDTQMELPYGGND